MGREIESRTFGIERVDDRGGRRGVSDVSRSHVGRAPNGVGSFFSKNRPREKRSSIPRRENRV
jgi:hypothetical protein